MATRVEAPCDNLLLRALSSVLTDADFDLPSKHAIAARKSAKCAMEWCESHLEESHLFLSKVQQRLNACYTTQKKFTTQKEKMWEQYFKVRSTSTFEGMWDDFLTKQCGTEASPTLYQHITDIIFNQLISEKFPPAQQTDTEDDQQEEQVQLDYNEKNALRYVGGYVTRVLYQRMQESSNLMKKEFCLCLTEMNDVDPDDMVDESEEWMDAVDRGGLKHINNMVYMLFVSMEKVFRRHIDSATDLTLGNEIKDKILADEDTQFYWAIISSNWDVDVVRVLLGMITDMWIKIRGHSTARAWLERFKLEKKKSVQKSKGIRKHLISATTATKSTEA